MNDIRLSCEAHLIEEAYHILNDGRYRDPEKISLLQDMGFDLEEILILALEGEGE